MTAPVVQPLARPLRAAAVVRPPAETDDRFLPFDLARALNEAVVEGRASDADRLARAALRVPRRPAPLDLSLARYHASRGRVEAALATCGESSSPDAVLFRSCCLAALGRHDESRLELCRLADKPSSPREARRLKALLDWRAGDIREAAAALRSIARDGDAEARFLLAAMAVADCDNGEAEAIERTLRQLEIHPSTRLSTRIALGTLQIGGSSSSAPAPSRGEIDELVEQLLAAEAVIPTLIEAQRRRFDEPSARLLLASLAGGWRRASDVAGWCAAAAELSDAIEGGAAAITWIERGLAASPRSAVLLRMAAQISNADRVDAARPATAIRSAA
jgi:hypothetical protein